MIRILVMSIIASIFVPLTSAMSNVLPKISEQQLPSPIKVMQQVELLHVGIISRFHLERNSQGDLSYRIDVIESQEHQVTHFSYSINNGLLINEGVNDLSSYEVEKLNAVLFLKVNRLSFSNMVKSATTESRGHILEAKLEHDLGVNYLSVELVDAQGKHMVAFDLDEQRPMPVLKWH
ncbi:hypothetical protein [Shewanella gelidii]|nr:hypothetical protein [Shewanella gelidii]MCL1098890.1 hypothetical protein [Shewanella gelidii]